MLEPRLNTSITSHPTGNVTDHTRLYQGLSVSVATCVAVISVVFAVIILAPRERLSQTKYKVVVAVRLTAAISVIGTVTGAAWLLATFWAWVYTPAPAPGELIT